MSLKLPEILAALERIAPLSFAEPWDNVGLLLEPEPAAPATGPPLIERAVLTIDLDDSVLDEAEAYGARLVIAYHPPIFRGLSRLRSSEPAERVVVRCLARGISVYSPHTAVDAAPGGVNDWLLEAFGEGPGQPCLPHAEDARFGQGRWLTLSQPLSLPNAVAKIKAHLGLSQVRVAAAPAHAPHAGSPAGIRKVAVCAGSGRALFEKLSGFDLYLTGELGHHDVRAKCLVGESVVLCEHTHSERGFLPRLAERLRAETAGAVGLHIAQCDREPLSIV